MKVGIIDTKQIVSKSSNRSVKEPKDETFKALLLNKNEANQKKTETADVSSASDVNQTEGTTKKIKDLLSGLGLSPENMKAFLNFFEKTKAQSKGQADNSLADLLSALQMLVQVQPNELKDLLGKLSFQHKAEIESLLQDSSLNDGLDVKLAYIMLLENTDQKNLPKLDKTTSLNVAKELKNGLMQVMEQNNIEPEQSTLKKLFQLIDGKLASDSNNTSQVSKMNRKDYLLQVYNRNFNQPLAENNTGVTVMTKNESPEVADFVGVVDGKAAQNHENAQQMLPIGRLQQFVLFVAQNQSQDSPSQESFIKDFQNILAKSQLNATNGVTKLMITLYPEHLGSLQIELIHQNNTLIAKIMASTANAKDMLESQIQNLKNAFQAQNIPVEKIDISQQLQQNFDQPLYHQERDRDQQPQQQQENQKKTKSEQSIGSFEEELLNFQV